MPVRPGRSTGRGHRAPGSRRMPGAHPPGWPCAASRSPRTGTSRDPRPAGPERWHRRTAPRPAARSGPAPPWRGGGPVRRRGPRPAWPAPDRRPRTTPRRPGRRRPRSGGDGSGSARWPPAPWSPTRRPPRRPGGVPGTGAGRLPPRCGRPRVCPTPVAVRPRTGTRPARRGPTSPRRGRTPHHCGGRGRRRARHGGGWPGRRSAGWPAPVDGPATGSRSTGPPGPVARAPGPAP